MSTPCNIISKFRAQIVMVMIETKGAQKTEDTSDKYATLAHALGNEDQFSY